MRYTPDGIIDSTFAVNGYVSVPGIDIDNRFYDLAIQPNGKIVACGHYSTVFSGSQDFDVLVLRTDSTGIPDANFGSGGIIIQPINGGIDDAFGLEIDNGGNLFVCGYTTLPVTLDLAMILLKYDSTGAPVNSFGNNGLVTFNVSQFDVAMDVKIQPDNKILLGGSSGISFFGPRDFALWRYLPGGAPDPSFGTNGFLTTTVLPGFQDCNTITLQDDGKILAAGKTFSGTNNDIAVVRYLNDLGTAVHENVFSNNNFQVFPNPALQGSFLTIDFKNMEQKIVSVTMLDCTGREIFNTKITDNNASVHSFQIPENIQSGMYLLKISVENENYLSKFVVK